MNTRVKIVGLLVVLLFTGIVARLFFWQILKGKNLANEARAQRESGNNITAPRGSILASDNTWLVARGVSYLVFANPTKLTEPVRSVAEKLAPFFIEVEEGEDERRILLNEIERIVELLERDAFWIPLKHRVSESDKRNIEALDVTGIGFETQEARLYPEASSAAHLLGFVGKDEEGGDIGYFGLEGFYNLTLSGKPGFVEQEFDARGQPILIGDSKEISAINGVDLLTNIDKTVQLTIEKELARAIENYGAKAGTAIVMNPKNGALLGMASFPSYDPSKYFEFGNELFKNPAVSDTFEPGSIFKVLVMASGLDAGVVEPDTKCDICAGPLKVDRFEIGTWNNEYRADSTMTEVIVNSDNVGMAFVGQKLGADTMYDYLSSFGIGEKTGIDLQGEVAGVLREKGTWNIVDLATASFGQGVSVTPIQMIRAVAAIANDGVLPTPQVVGSLIGEDWEQQITIPMGHRVISEKSATEITAMMAEAAKSGESKWIQRTGFKVAGKTGTAQIPIAGHYDEEKTIASFVGFAPHDDPKFVMLVTLREPETSPWASETAAPAWYSIADDLFVYFGVRPEN